MKHKLLIGAFLSFLAITPGMANALNVEFTSDEAPAAIAGLSVSTEWSGLGLTLSNSSWYFVGSGADGFDGAGIYVTDINSPAVITLNDAESLPVSIDWWAVDIGSPSESVFTAYDVNHASLGSLSVTTDGNGIDKFGRFTFTGNVKTLEMTGVAASISTVTTVPEPETYAMLLAGIGLMGLAGRSKLI